MAMAKVWAHQKNQNAGGSRGPAAAPAAGRTVVSGTAMPRHASATAPPIAAPISTTARQPSVSHRLSPVSRGASMARA